METKNYANREGMPLGFGMALAQNTKAMEYFSTLSETERQALINQTHRICSKEEMQAFINQLGERG